MLINLRGYLKVSRHSSVPRYYWFKKLHNFPQVMFLIGTDIKSANKYSTIFLPQMEGLGLTVFHYFKEFLHYTDYVSDKELLNTCIHVCTNLK